MHGGFLQDAARMAAKYSTVADRISEALPTFESPVGWCLGEGVWICVFFSRDEANIIPLKARVIRAAFVYAVPDLVAIYHHDMYRKYSYHHH